MALPRLSVLPTDITAGVTSGHATGHANLAQEYNAAYDVTRHTGIPDGTTDNSAAIVEACAAATAAGYGAIWFPRHANPYILQDTVVLAGDIALRSNGAIIKQTGVDKDDSDTFFSMFSLSAGYNTLFDGLEFLGENAAADVAYTNMTFAAITSTAHGDRSGVLRVNQCRFLNLYGFTIAPIHDFRHVSAHHCYSRACNSGFNWASQSSAIIGCMFDETDTIEIAGDRMLIDGVIIRDAVSLSGIVVGGTTSPTNARTHAIVSNCIVDGVSNGMGIGSGGGLSDVTIANCHVKSAVDYGVRLSALSNESINPERLRIYGCTVSGMGGIAFDVTGRLSDVEIANCYGVVTGLGSRGLRFAGQGVVHDNYFRGDMADVWLEDAAVVRMYNNDAPTLHADEGATREDSFYLYDAAGTLKKIEVTAENGVTVASV